MPCVRLTRLARRALPAAVLAAAVTAAPAQAITTVLSSNAVKHATPGAAIEVVRNNIVIGRGTADPTAPADPGGSLGTGGVCWTNYTPQILAGDTVQEVGGASMTVEDVAISGITPDPGLLFTTVNGRAPDPLTALTVTLGDATTAPTATSPGNWAATFTPSPAGTTATASFAGTGGTTTVDSPARATSCLPPAPDAISTVDRTLVNIANQGTQLQFSGPGNGTGFIVGTLTPPVVTSPGGTWTSLVDTAGLQEGPNVAMLGPTTVTINKDTTMPGPATSSPPPGRYLTPPSIALVPPENGAVLHYTTDGSTPTQSSPTYSKPLSIPSSETIRVFAVDPAGNESPTVALGYQIGPAGGGGGGVVPGVTPPGGGITPTPGPSPGAQKPRIGTVKVAKRVSLRKLRRGLVTTVDLGEGTTAVRFTVYRRFGKKLRLVASIVRVPGKAGTYRVKLNGRALGLTRPGLYRLKIVPGLSRSTLDQSAARTVWIRVVR